MKASRFMRRPFIVTGYRITEENMDAIAKWCEGHVIRDTERPFVRVPVDRAMNKKQTEAYIGTWVILSIQRDQRSFKVYTQEWLEKSFMAVPDEIEDDREPVELILDEPLPIDVTPTELSKTTEPLRSLPSQRVRPVNFRTPRSV